MPAVCHEALDQLYAYNRRKRQQYYFLSKLVPSSEEFNKGSKARTALEVIVHEKKLDLINHTVIQKFIRWAKFWNLFFHFQRFKCTLGKLWSKRSSETIFPIIFIPCLVDSCSSRSTIWNEIYLYLPHRWLENIRIFACNNTHFLYDLGRISRV